MSITRRDFAGIASSALLSSTMGARAQDAGRIGFFGPLTGNFAGLGIEARKGAELAVKQANAAGGAHGRKIELIRYEYDDQGVRTQAVALARKMIEEDQVSAIIDGSLSLTSVAAAPIISDAKVPMVCAYSNAIGVVKGNDRVFRWASVADVQGWIMAHHAMQERNFKRFALLFQDEEYGRGIINGADVGLKTLGGQVLYRKAFSPSEREFRAMLTEIKSLNVDAVLMSGFGATLAAVGRQGGELGLFPKCQLYVGCDMSEIDWYNGIGEYGEGTIGTLEFIATADTPFTNKFRRDFEKEYGEKIIQHEAGLTYDATRWLLDAIGRGGWERDGIFEALQATKSFTNLSGVEVKITELREPLLPIALGSWSKQNKEIQLLKYIQDPELINPRPWYKYYT